MMIRRGQGHCAAIRLSFHSFIHSCTALFVYFLVFMYAHLIYAITLFPYVVYEKRKNDRRHVNGHT